MTSSFRSLKISFSAFFSKSMSFSSFSDLNIKQVISDICTKPAFRDLFSYDSERKRNNKRPSDKWRFLLPIQYSYHSPQYPIVLCHGRVFYLWVLSYKRQGLGFFEKIPSSLPTFQLHYWGSIFESLKKLGCQVYVTKVPSTGTIAHRAKELSRQLSSMVKGKRVNLVAHSMVLFSKC